MSRGRYQPEDRHLRAEARGVVETRRCGRWCAGAAGNQRRPRRAGLEVRVGSPSVTTSTTGCSCGCRRKCRFASSRAWWRFVPFSHMASRAVALDLHDLRVAAEPDHLQVVAPEPRRDELVQRQGGALHRHPATVHRHRERGVDEEGHGGASSRLGLDHLHVADVEPDAVAPGRPLGGGAGEGVGHRAGDVPGLGVTELPCPARPAGLTGSARGAGRHVTGPVREPPGDVAQQRAAELTHRSRRQAQGAVGRAGEVAAVAQRLLERREGPGVDGRLVTELAGEGVEVDVVHAGAGVRLRQLVGEAVELRDVLQHPGAVTEPESLLAAELLGAVPVLTRAQPAAGRRAGRAGP